MGVLQKASHLNRSIPDKYSQRGRKAASEDLGETCPDLAKQDVAWTVLPPGFGKILREMETKHRTCKMVTPDLPVESRVRSDIRDTFVNFANERKPSPPQPHVETALTSSKVKLVTLQIQNDLLYMQQNIQEVNSKTNLIHYIRLAQLQFSFKKIFEKY